MSSVPLYSEILNKVLGFFSKYTHTKQKKTQQQTNTDEIMTVVVEKTETFEYLLQTKWTIENIKTDKYNLIADSKLCI